MARSVPALYSAGLLLLAACAHAGEFRAGAAQVDLTPSADAALRLSGYENRTQGFAAIHDKLYVRALVLDDGRTRAAIAAADVLGFGEPLWKRISARLEKETGLGPDHVLLAAVHTHGAPATGAEEAVDGKQGTWVAQLEDAVVSAVKQAAARLQPARLGFGTGQANVNVNRRARMADGTWFLGINPDGPSDKTVAVVRVDTIAGVPIAVFSNYAVHGTVMGQQNLAVTGDLPGAAARYVESNFGQNVVALWTSGAAGDQNAIYGPGNDFDKLDVLGQILGEEIVRVAKSIETRPDVTVRTAQAVVRCPGQKMAPDATRKAPRFVEADPVPIRLTLLQIDNVALAGVSGEVLTGIHAHLQKEFGPRLVTVTHVNGSSGYLPDDAAYAQVSYEIVATRLRSGCAEEAIVKGFRSLLAPPAGTESRRVPPRHSAQLVEGFGINLDLPREPRLPWNRRWWTRVFESGVKWVRLGQYENSSEKTSWDWVEQTPGHYSVRPEVDEAIRSLADNGVRIEMQLLYSNPLYQGDPAHRPARIQPAPPGISPSLDSRTNPIFYPPSDEEQITAFLNYVRFMVDRYKGTIQHWQIWNEPNIAFWQPIAKDAAEYAAKGRQYGRLLARAADVIHSIDPQAKVIFGGLTFAEQSSPAPRRFEFQFTRAALAECASKIDIFAYHTYPGYGANHMPEEAETLLQAGALREQILRQPEVRRDLPFWIDEWNAIPGWRDSSESVQARYVPRFYLHCHSLGIKPVMWSLVPGGDGNENDMFGLIHGDTASDDAFQPREAYRGFSITNALFGQTELDDAQELEIRGLPERWEHGQVRNHAFRDTVSGKRIYAFWLAVPAEPRDSVAVEAEAVLHDPALQDPVLIDVQKGVVRRLEWKDKAARVARIPIRDGVMALADASYLDWAALPEAPAGLEAARSTSHVHLHWKLYEQGHAVEVQRSVGYGPWIACKSLAANATEFSEEIVDHGHITYRVRTLGRSGPSPWSNPAWIDVEK